MRTPYIIGVALCVLAAACQRQPSVDEEALMKAEVAKAGKAYYDYLVRNQVDSFVAGIDGTQKATADYRKWLTDNTRQFLHAQDSLHGGIRTAMVDSTECSQKDSTARVYLRVGYGDGTNERVLLPMLCRKGKWYMR